MVKEASERQTAKRNRKVKDEGADLAAADEYATEQPPSRSHP